MMCVCVIGKREISELEVECDSSSAKRRCPWVGTLGTLEEHVDTCEFYLVPCPKGCEDDSCEVRQFMRNDLNKHLEEDCPNRDHECEHCGEKGTYAYIEFHDKMCIKKEVSCSQDGCTERMQRQYVKKHVCTDCQYATVSCKYSTSLGCDIKLQRKDMPSHEQDSEAHLNLALDSINSQQVELRNGEAIKFKLTDYQMKKENNRYVESPSYYINGYHVALRVYTNGYGPYRGTHVRVSVQILKGRHDAKLKWPLVGKVAFTLLNQVKDANHRYYLSSLEASDNMQVGSSRGNGKFISLPELDYNPVRKTQYLKDDTLYFRMSLCVADHKPWLD